MTELQQTAGQNGPGDDQDDLSGPFSERGVRFLKIAVIVMGVLLVVGFVAIIFIITYRAVNLGEGRDAAPAATAEAPAPASAIPGFDTSDIAVAPDATVNMIELHGDRMAVHVISEDGSEILIVDTNSGALVGRVRLKPSR